MKINHILSLAMAVGLLAGSKTYGQPTSQNQDISTTIKLSVPRQDVEAVFGVLDTFIAYFRQPLAKNLPKHLSTYHFPHVRIASGTVSVLQAATDITADSWLAKLPADWDYSEWVSRDIVQASASKIHVLTVFRRFRKDGSAIADETSLYILEKQGQKWGIRGRSSYAK